MQPHYCLILFKTLLNQARSAALMLAMILLAAMLAGCDSDSPSVTDDYPPLDVTPPPEPECSAEPPAGPSISTGVYIDSFVGNINYLTESQSGRTSVDGEYLYIKGETVIFSIGGAELPVTLAKAVVTPLDIAQSSSITDTVVTNIVRLMLSLDVDGDPDNGILIDDQAHIQAAAESFSFSSPTFETDVANLVANSGSVTTALVDVDTAVQHLAETLADFPVAMAGDDSIVVSGVAANNFQLDGSDSTDPQDRPLTYSWSIVSQPTCLIANCTPATLSNADSVDAKLVCMRQPGDYVVELVVTNGTSSDADQVTIRLNKNSPSAGKLFGFALISFATLSLFIRRRSARRQYLNTTDQQPGDKS